MNLSQLSLDYFRCDHIRQPDGFIDHFKYLPRPFSSLAVLLDGEWEYREYRHSDTELTGNAGFGDLLFVPMGSTYDGTWHNDGKRIHAISLHFETSELGLFGSRHSGVQVIRAEDFLAVANNPTFDHMKEFGRIAEICDSTNNNPGTRERFELMWRFYRLLDLTIPCLKLREDPINDREIEPALKYLKKNYTLPCTVSELAKLCNLSDSHFFVRFRQATGTTPVEYKNRLMIANAERLLLDEPSLSIEDVAERMGFTSSRYFRMVFKEIVQCTPREFRKNAHNIL